MSHRSLHLRFLLVLLLIEFLDELIGGVREAAWPLIRSDLGLSYAQIGLLLGLPGLLGSLVEPVLGLLADAGRKRAILLGGGVIFVAACFLAAASASFWPLLLAYLLFFPASGAYVSLSQTVLMDREPERREQNMARWTFAGSFGYVLGPLLVGGATVLSLSWRVPFWSVAVLALTVLAFSWGSFTRQKMIPDPDGRHAPGLLESLRFAWQALRGGGVLRWLVLLEFSDLVLDVFYSYLALYLVDVSGLPPATAALGVAAWTGFGLLGDFLLIPLLERVNGLAYLKVSAATKLVLFPVFFLTTWLPGQFALLGLLGLLNAGWYAILQGRMYASLPGRSGTAMALNGLVGFAGKLVPLLIGLLAQRFGLGAALWIILLGPIALLVGLPRSERPKNEYNGT